MAKLRLEVALDSLNYYGTYELAHVMCRVR